jgi:hypothetical protein
MLTTGKPFSLQIESVVFIKTPCFWGSLVHPSNRVRVNMLKKIIAKINFFMKIKTFPNHLLG